jgi:hypothetical protein
MRVLAAALSLISVLARVAPESSTGRPGVPEPVVVPFERAPSPYIVILVPVTGGSCEALVFDTGTNTTVLAPSLAARVGLAGGSATSVESLNGAVRAVAGAVHGIGFDGIPAGGSRLAIAADVAGLREFGDAVAGLYGHNWLTGTDYLIDYDAKRIVMGSAGRLPSPSGGLRVPLTWVDGRPAIAGTVSAHGVEPFPARFVLDSGADHVVLFGHAAEQLALAADRATMVVDSGFGRREVPTAAINVDVGGGRRPVVAELRRDLKDRGEDGLVPTAFFRSVFVSAAGGVVIFDARVSVGDLNRSSGNRRGRGCRAPIDPHGWPVPNGHPVTR